MKSLKLLIIALSVMTINDGFSAERMCVRGDIPFGDFCNAHQKWFNNVQAKTANLTPAIELKQNLEIKSKGKTRGRFLKKSDSCDMILTLEVDQEKVAGSEDVRLKKGLKMTYANSKVIANGYGPRASLSIKDENRGVTFIVSAVSSCTASDVIEFIQDSGVIFYGTTPINSSDCKRKAVEISSLEELLKNNKKEDLREASFNGSLPKEISVESTPNSSSTSNSAAI